MRFRPQRYPAQTELRILQGEPAHTAELTNLSATGARLNTTARLPMSSMVTLSYVGLRLLSRVVWSREQRTGLEFVTPISGPELNALRGAAGGPADAWGSSGGFRFRELS